MTTRRSVFTASTLAGLLALALIPLPAQISGAAPRRSAAPSVITEPASTARAHQTPRAVPAPDLPGHELVSLPSRPDPIERDKARRYFCPGDFNRDDVIDGRDLADFTEAFASNAGPFAEFLDLNLDGVIDAADLEAFIHANDNPCDPAQWAANRAVMC